MPTTESWTDLSRLLLPGSSQTTRRFLWTGPQPPTHEQIGWLCDKGCSADEIAALRAYPVGPTVVFLTVEHGSVSIQCI